MNIITIPLRCLRQKWGRSAALLSVFLLGVAAITALNNVSSSVAEGFEKKLSAFGANIAITPKRETLQISYGGIPLGNATVDNGYIPLAETQRAIEGIPLRDRISVVAPKLAGLVAFTAKAGEATVLVPLVGVNFDSEVELKQFWHVRGSIPGVATMQAPDPLMQRMDEQHAKHAAQADAPPKNTAGTPAPDSNMTAPNAHGSNMTAANMGDASAPGPDTEGAGTAGTGMADTAGTNMAGTDVAPVPIAPNAVSTTDENDDCCAGIMDIPDFHAGQPGHAGYAAQDFNPAQADMGQTAMLDAARPDGQGLDHTAPSAQHTVPGEQHTAPQQTASQHPDQTLTPERHLLAGATVAERLKLSPGQAIWLNGAQYLVEGVLQPTGSDDDSVLFAHLPEAQKLFHAPDAASFIEVAALCSGCPIEDIVSELGAALPGQDIRALRQVVAQRMYSISFAQNMALVVTVVILFSACVMVVMSMLVSVNERRKEIGLLRAVGFSRRAVFFIFAAEALVIGFLAGVAGYAAGYFAGSKVLVAMQIEAAAYPAFSFAALFGYGLMASALAVLAAAFPAYKAARANPAEALTSL
ncbi:ABC transporter permease [Desulfovibrio sp.]|uniref:ABC transporter permease n=1 Tax=Desulfovibrio sp. TaxID=885 RepID=UPI003D129DBA